MAIKKKGPQKVTLIKGCVVREAGEGKKAKNYNPLDEVSVTSTDARFLIACGNAVDASTDEGKEEISRVKSELAPAKKTTKK